MGGGTGGDFGVLGGCKLIFQAMEFFTPTTVSFCWGGGGGGGRPGK